MAIYLYIYIYIFIYFYNSFYNPRVYLALVFLVYWRLESGSGRQLRFLPVDGPLLLFWVSEDEAFSTAWCGGVIDFSPRILEDSWRFLEILGVVVFVGDWWDAFSCWRIGGGDCLRFLEEFVGILIVVVTSWRCASVVWRIQVLQWCFRVFIFSE